MPFYSSEAEPNEIVQPTEGLELPFPVLHPALRQSCADVLGWSRQDVDALIDDPDAEMCVDPSAPTRLLREGGPSGGHFGIRALTLALEAAKPELLLRRLPTPPEGDRLAPWRRLVAAARKYTHYRDELDAPESVLSGGPYSLQQELDALVDLPAPPAGSDWVIDATSESELRLATSEEWQARAEMLLRTPKSHSGLLWIDEQRICICEAGRTRIVSALNGTRYAEIDVQLGLAPMGCDEEHVVFFDPTTPPGYDPNNYLAVQVLSLSTLAFVECYPPSLPLVVLEHAEPEYAILVDLRTGWTLPLEPQDRTHLQAYSRALDVVWVGDSDHEVFDTHLGARLYLGRDQDLVIDPPVWLDPNGQAIEGQETNDDEDSPHAIHRDGDLVLHAWRTVGPIGAPVFGLGFRPLAMGFSSDGTQLAALVAGAISIFETGAPRLVRRIAI